MDYKLTKVTKINPLEHFDRTELIGGIFDIQEIPECGKRFVVRHGAKVLTTTVVKQTSGGYDSFMITTQNTEYTFEKM